MYIPKDLQKENSFVDVALPTNRALFSRFGQAVPTANMYSGDDTVPLNQSKSDQIEDYQKFAEQEAEKMSKTE